MYPPLSKPSYYDHNSQETSQSTITPRIYIPSRGPPTYSHIPTPRLHSPAPKPQYLNQTSCSECIRDVMELQPHVVTNREGNPGAEDAFTAFTNRLNEKFDPSIQADLRHPVLRSETASRLQRQRSAFRDSELDRGNAPRSPHAEIAPLFGDALTELGRSGLRAGEF
ncbi:hypothetical protein K443DRAFT_15760 [Laccaria amethystina LaAM-08-1]|uniref:Unplaced genomic scaffold K443scaffold_875, whole genome shotgun sequence n=1 Tax=Laccaria amethystina LaAM-08-1 TaxID=1095629 RepID=A0A0C9WQ80_9AGAR|nr:hypothetical protein K443DRAFT_15760 [Laccaria amethystina LaAM-08-1]